MWSGPGRASQLALHPWLLIMTGQTKSVCLEFVITYPTWRDKKCRKWRLFPSHFLVYVCLKLSEWWLQNIYHSVVNQQRYKCKEMLQVFYLMSFSNVKWNKIILLKSNNYLWTARFPLENLKAQARLGSGNFSSNSSLGATLRLKGTFLKLPIPSHIFGCSLSLFLPEYLNLWICKSWYYLGV